MKQKPKTQYCYTIETIRKGVVLVKVIPINSKEIYCLAYNKTDLITRAPKFDGTYTYTRLIKCDEEILKVLKDKMSSN